MRHSDINLTMSRYTHIFRGQESEAIANLPDLSLPSKQSQKATGTDNSVITSAYKKLTKKSYFDCKSMSLIGSEEGQQQSDTEQNSEEIKSLQMADLGTEKEPVSTNDINSKPNTPGRTQTCDLRIRNP